MFCKEFRQQGFVQIGTKFATMILSYQIGTKFATMILSYQ